MKKKRWPGNKETLVSGRHKSTAKLPQKWGQYVLTDKEIIGKIISALELKHEDTVLEIGAGTGVLSVIIKEKAGRLIAVEIDKMLCTILESKGIKAVKADFLKMDLSSLPPRVKIVSNLPYYITTPIITRIFKRKVPFSCMALMMQEEVARKITAGPGGRDYRMLSIMAQFYSDLEVLAPVSRNCFQPVPKVDSCLVRFRKKKPVPLVFPEEFLFKVIRAGFGSRRKMLRNALSGWNGLGDINIDLSRRAESLTIGEFCRLAEGLWIRQ